MNGVTFCSREKFLVGLDLVARIKMTLNRFIDRFQSLVTVVHLILSLNQELATWFMISKVIFFFYEFVVIVVCRKDRWCCFRFMRCLILPPVFRHVNSKVQAFPDWRVDNCDNSRPVRFLEGCRDQRREELVHLLGQAVFAQVSRPLVRLLRKLTLKFWF